MQFALAQQGDVEMFDLDHGLASYPIPAALIDRHAGSYAAANGGDHHLMLRRSEDKSAASRAKLDVSRE